MAVGCNKDQEKGETSNVSINKIRIKGKWEGQSYKASTKDKSVLRQYNGI
jgi:hypothetical protein